MKHLYLIIVEGNGNAQDSALYAKINFVSPNVVPNVPQRLFIDVVSITNNSYQSIEGYVSQQPR